MPPEPVLVLDTDKRADLEKKRARQGKADDSEAAFSLHYLGREHDDVGSLFLEPDFLKAYLAELGNSDDGLDAKIDALCDPAPTAPLPKHQKASVRISTLLDEVLGEGAPTTRQSLLDALVDFYIKNDGAEQWPTIAQGFAPFLNGFQSTDGLARKDPTEVQKP